ALPNVRCRGGTEATDDRFSRLRCAKVQIASSRQTAIARKSRRKLSLQIRASQLQQEPSQVWRGRTQSQHSDSCTFRATQLAVMLTYGGGSGCWNNSRGAPSLSRLRCSRNIGGAFASDSRDRCENAEACLPDRYARP